MIVWVRVKRKVRCVVLVIVCISKPHKEYVLALERKKKEGYIVRVAIENVSVGMILIRTSHPPLRFRKKYSSTIFDRRVPQVGSSRRLRYMQRDGTLRKNQAEKRTKGILLPRNRFVSVDSPQYNHVSLLCSLQGRICNVLVGVHEQHDLFAILRRVRYHAPFQMLHWSFVL